MKRIVITKYENKYLAVFLDGDTPVKIRAFDSLNEFPDKVYTGIVRDVKQSMSASFVRYSGDRIGYLRGCAYKSNELIPVMVKKETIDKKDDEITDKILLTGVYAIVSSSFKGIRYSKSISQEFKNTFEKAIVDKNITNELGIIIRSNALNTSFEAVFNEIVVLSSELKEILKNSAYRTAGSTLYTGISSLMQFIISENISEYSTVLTDIDDVYDHVSEFILDKKSNDINVDITINKYVDNYPLAALISLKKIIDYATSKQIYLKSGAHIVIEHTEALTAIDINSGTTLHKGDRAEIIHKVNIEASEEIIKQITLRNLSGIIIADFINEKSEDNNEELLANIKKLIARNDKTIKCHGMTRLGLIEFSRKREFKPFREQLWK